MGTGTGLVFLTLILLLASRRGEEPPEENGEIPPEENGEEPPEENGEEPPEIPDGKILHLNRIDVLSINGIPFIETGVSGGVPYGRLRDTIIQPDLYITVRMYNKSIRLDDSSYRDLGLHVFYQMSGGPSFSGRAGIQLYRDEQGYPYRNPPYEFSVAPRNVIGAGSWVPKLYSAEFRLFGQYYEAGIGSATLESFRVLDFLECIGSGNANI